MGVSIGGVKICGGVGVSVKKGKEREIVEVRELVLLCAACVFA